MSRIKKTPGLSVDIPSDMHKALKADAKSKDMKVSQIIRGLIREYLKK
jgi:hypothetical protein